MQQVQSQGGEGVKRSRIGREYETRDAGNVICVREPSDGEYPVIVRPTDSRLRSYRITKEGRFYAAADSWDERDVIRGPLP